MRNGVRIFGGLILVISIMSLVAFSLSGCGSAKKNNANKTKYELDESLLGAGFEVPTTGKSLRLPKGFIPLVDSELVILREAVRQQLGGILDMTVQQNFHEDTSRSVVLIYSANNLNLAKDTSNFIGMYRLALLTAFGETNVKLDSYNQGEILVKEFIAADSLNGIMRTQLICLSKTDNGVVLEYITPLNEYDKFKKSFESSIASISVKHGG